MFRTLRLPLIVGAAVLMTAAAWPSEAHAQRGRGRTAVRVSRPVIVRPYVYRPYYYYDPLYWNAGFGWYGWYGAPYRYQRYPYPPYRYYDYDEASARIEVEPKDAQVYVDGYYVGMVDDFDGVFQRLHVRSGPHVLEIYKEGFRTIREQVDFRRGETYKVKFRMEPLGPGEASMPRPAPEPVAAPPRDRDAQERGRDRGRPDERRMPPPRDPIVRGDAGAVAIRVQPAGAEVIIDGERWEGPQGREPLVVHLDEGSHRIEVRMSGYRTFTSEIRVRRGETVPLNINLRADR